MVQISLFTAQLQDIEIMIGGNAIICNDMHKASNTIHMATEIMVMIVEGKLSNKTPDHARRNNLIFIFSCYPIKSCVGADRKQE